MVLCGPGKDSLGRQALMYGSVRSDEEEGNGHFLSTYNVPGVMACPFPVYPPNILHVVR